MTDQSPTKKTAYRSWPRQFTFLVITRYTFYKVGVEIPQIIRDLYWKWQTVIL